MTEHPFDDIETLALGDLDESAALRIMDHADACPTCAVLVAQAFAGIAKLGTSEQLATSDALARKIADSRRKVDRSKVGSSRWPRLQVAVAALTAASIALFVWNIDLRSSQQTIPVDALVHSHFAHHGLHGALGAAKVLVASDGAWVYLIADQLRAGEKYDVWERRGALLSRLGTVQADRTGRVTQFWRQPAGATTGFIVTENSADPMRNGNALRWP